MTAAPIPTKDVAWITVAAEPDVDAALAKARQQGKPVLLYWGATWCPPCNQLRSTLFNRRDFAERARQFVTVHVDGDRPGAQKVGARFRVQGYPTVIVLRGDGQEMTRLDGAVEPEQFLQAMQIGMTGGRPASALLADALAGKSISGDAWRMLALYGWDDDAAQIAPPGERALVLAKLAAQADAQAGTLGADAASVSTRLWLKAAALSDDGRGLKPDAAMRTRLDGVLGDPAKARAQMDVLIAGAAALVRWATPEASAERTALVGRMDRALAALQTDVTLSRGDRAAALDARIATALTDQPPEVTTPTVPSALRDNAKQTAAQIDREITDGFERQAVIPTLAAALARARMWQDSDALLHGNLARSHAPYYLMLQLASNARKQGRSDDALQWYRKAFERSEGASTRVQWGASYLAALVELQPRDEKTIAALASQVYALAAADPAGYLERTGRSMERVSKALKDWSASGHQAAAAHIAREAAGVCAKVPTAQDQRQRCLKLAATSPAVRS